jgi:hypothetical protein
MASAIFLSCGFYVTQLSSDCKQDVEPRKDTDGHRWRRGEEPPGQSGRLPVRRVDRRLIGEC